MVIIVVVTIRMDTVKIIGIKTVGVNKDKTSQIIMVICLQNLGKNPKIFKALVNIVQFIECVHIPGTNVAEIQLTVVT